MLQKVNFSTDVSRLSPQITANPTVSYALTANQTPPALKQTPNLIAQSSYQAGSRRSFSSIPKGGLLKGVIAFDFQRDDLGQTGQQEAFQINKKDKMPKQTMKTGHIPANLFSCIDNVEYERGFEASPGYIRM